MQLVLRWQGLAGTKRVRRTGWRESSRVARGRRVSEGRLATGGGPLCGAAFPARLSRCGAACPDRPARSFTRACC